MQRQSSSKSASTMPRTGLRTQTSGIDRNPVAGFLRGIGLSQYAETLVSNGFDDLETLLDIEEEHMQDLGILPGHMLKLKKRLRELGTSSGTSEAKIDPSKTVVASRVPRALQLQPATPDAHMTTTVQRSWEMVQAVGSDMVGEVFYKRFFSQVPESIELFPLSVRQRYGDWASDIEEPETLGVSLESPALRKLWARVVDAIGSAVAGLHDFNRLVPQLQQLGMRHVGYGLKPEYWKVAEKILIEVLREGLGDKFTREAENAWVMVYGFMTATMLAGFEAAKAGESRLSGLSTAIGSGAVTPSSRSGSIVSPRSTGQASYSARSTSPINQLPSLLSTPQRKSKKHIYASDSGRG